MDGVGGYSLDLRLSVDEVAKDKVLLISCKAAASLASLQTRHTQHVSRIARVQCLCSSGLVYCTA